MNYKYFLLIFLFLYSCTTIDTNESQKDIVPSDTFSNKGFALLFNEDLKKKN